MTFIPDVDSVLFKALPKSLPSCEAANEITVSNPELISNAFQSPLSPSLWGSKGQSRPKLRGLVSG